MNPGCPVLQAAPSAWQDYLFVSHVKQSFIFYSFYLWGVLVIFLFWHFNFLWRDRFVKNRNKLWKSSSCSSAPQEGNRFCFSFRVKFAQCSEKRKILITLSIVFKSHVDCTKHISCFYHIFTIFFYRKGISTNIVEWCSSSLLSLLDPYVIYWHFNFTAWHLTNP